MTTEAAREAICRVGRSLFERGYVHATAGNISVRLAQAQGFLITPTDACLGRLEPADLAWIDTQGQQRDGAPASKTLALHRRIYAGDDAAHCVIHTHATELVALSLAGVWQVDAVLPPITPYFVMKVGRVPHIPYRRPGDAAVAALVATAIAQAHERAAPIRAVLLERLGPIVWQRSPESAMAVLEELEETARLWRLTRHLPAPLADDRIEELRHHFGAHW